MFHRGDTRSGGGRLLDESSLVTPDLQRGSRREFLASTPGKLSVLATVLIAAALVAGVITSTVIGAREQRTENLRAHTEPLANAAQGLYSSLSIADAAVTSSFISGAIEPLAVRDRYNQAIGDASNALVTATYGVSSGDVESLQLLTEMSRHLAVYTDLIATARANDNVGNPVGVAYLRQASALMQNTILPLAERLYAEQARAVADTLTHTAQLPATAITVTTVVLIALAIAHMYLARKSRRRCNPGLIVAALLMVSLIVWLVVAGVVSTSTSERARTEGTQPLSVVTKARILAQQARADETLALLQPGSDSSEGNYVRHTAALAEILGQNSNITSGHAAEAALADASAAFDGWRDAHQALQQNLSEGDYQGAANVAVGPGSLASTAQFRSLDEALENAITELRAEELAFMARTYRSMSLLAVGSIVIGVLAGFAVAGGIRPRLSEYH